MKESELNSLIETAKEQLTADYACYFWVRYAEIIIELANKELKKKPFIDEDLGYCCPCCKQTVYNRKYISEGIYRDYLYPYCANCGQRL